MGLKYSSLAKYFQHYVAEKVDIGAWSSLHDTTQVWKCEHPCMTLHKCENVNKVFL